MNPRVFTVEAAYVPLQLRERGTDHWQDSDTCYVQLEFSTDNPGAVTLICDSMPWVFDRDLLSEARAHPDRVYGIGDVQVARADEIFEITLGHSSTDGARMFIPAQSVVMFCQMVEVAAPSGSDVYDVDLWLQELY